MSRPESEPDATVVARAVLRLARRLRAERPANSVTLGGLALLSTLHREGPMPAVDLARAERLQPQSLSRLIARLEADGMIARTPGEEDRRTLILAITTDGRRALRRDMDARRIWLSETMAMLLTDEERQRLMGAADILLRLAEAPGVGRG
jgi:DNA-binding MarR family transcriptional regulator